MVGPLALATGGAVVGRSGGRRTVIFNSHHRRVDALLEGVRLFDFISDGSIFNEVQYFAVEHLKDVQLLL